MLPRVSVKINLIYDSSKDAYVPEKGKILEVG